LLYLSGKTRGEKENCHKSEPAGVVNHVSAASDVANGMKAAEKRSTSKQCSASITARRARDCPRGEGPRARRGTGCRGVRQVLAQPPRRRAMACRLLYRSASARVWTNCAAHAPRPYEGFFGSAERSRRRRMCAAHGRAGNVRQCWRASGASAEMLCCAPRLSYENWPPRWIESGIGRTMLARHKTHFERSTSNAWTQ